MAKINRIEKCRKEQMCSKCKKVIPVGSPYLKATPFHRPAIIRCTECGLRWWETSGSYFIQTAGQLQEDWEKDGLDRDEIISQLEDLRDTCQESLDNMPEQLQYSESGETLQNRIDNLESIITSLENIDDFEEKKECLREEIEEQYRTDNEIDEDAELTEEQEEELESLVEDKATEEINEEIDEAMSELEVE